MDKDDMDNVLRYVTLIDCEKCGTNLITQMGTHSTLNLGILMGITPKDDGSKIIFARCPKCRHRNEILMEYQEE